MFVIKLGVRGIEVLFYLEFVIKKKNSFLRRREVGLVIFKFWKFFSSVGKFVDERYLGDVILVEVLCFFLV